MAGLPPAGYPGGGTYTIEDAELHVARLRGDTDRLSEAHTQDDMASGQVPNTPAGAHTTFSSGGHEKYLSSDGNAYNTGRMIQVNTGNVTLNNTGLTSIFTNVQAVSGGTYLAKADLLVAVGGTATALIFQLAGPAVGSVTNVQWKATYEAGGGESVFAAHQIGTLTSVTLPGSTTFPANATVHAWLSAYVTFTASGTVNVQAQLGNASATTQVSLGSIFEWCADS